MGGRVLIVDDDEAYRRTLARAVRRRGFNVTLAGDGDEALSCAEGEIYDVVVLDYQLPHRTGLDLLVELRTRAQGAVFIMATAFPDLDIAVRAMRGGAFDYVPKQGSLEECLLRIDRAAEVAALRQRMAEATAGTTADGDVDLIGDSAAMERLRQQLRALERAADTTVQLLGETGTGKGILAKWIHARSARAFEPFVAVDCTTIPATLVESELFGHEKGSFSGATGTKIGRVEAAGRGTLFLDEIGELELPIQAKLLRLLEEREYTRLGSTRPRRLEARVIAATNRDLSRAVSEGRFRADLRYRLEVFVVQTPALRDRGDDVLLLAAHFLAHHARLLGRDVPVMDSNVLDALMAYPFPGNVRELRNMVEQALLLSESSVLTLSDFPVFARRETAQRVSLRPAGAAGSPEPYVPAPAAAPDLAPPPRVHEPQTLMRPPSGASPSVNHFGDDRSPPTLAEIRAAAEEASRDRIVQALQRTGGNVSAAARELGVSRYRLLRQLTKHGLR